MRLLYVMDPMCGWCYGFQPELEQFLEKYPAAQVDWIMGGLAPDSNQPMDESLQQTISSYWHQIEEKTQVTFNHDFWKLNTPYRSTYPACRAVIAAERLKPNSAQQMAKAIQSAYYLEAKNPSLEETLIGCASSLGLDEKEFIQVFKSEETEQRFQQHLSITHQLQIQGFPALLYINDNNQAYPLALGYNNLAGLEQQLKAIDEIL
ncbi:DsbA family protein [Sessilibacter corallicola]|uniref:DsbA family protein n=1 Tax=Sessilibacter corallicola TaxID=2904075 RepID=UPI001E40E295|nr:DsbA family protein [Sessilibacter corallicola]MCE2028670.1 DsbA family protein [Sessilibacter corallicola]